MYGATLRGGRPAVARSPIRPIGLIRLIGPIESRNPDCGSGSRKDDGHAALPTHRAQRADAAGPLAPRRRRPNCISSEFERTQFLPPEEIRRLQLARLRSLLFHASDNCPFYRRRFEKAGFAPGLVHGLEDLRALPPLEKQEIQETAATWSPAIGRADLIRNQTGSLTGTPVTFYLSGDRSVRALRRRCATIAGPAGKSATRRPSSGAPRRPARRRLAPAGPQRPFARAKVARRRLSHRVAHGGVPSGTALLPPRIIQAYARAVVMFARFLHSHLV